MKRETGRSSTISNSREPATFIESIHSEARLSPRKFDMHFGRVKTLPRLRGPGVLASRGGRNEIFE